MRNLPSRERCMVIGAALGAAAYFVSSGMASAQYYPRYDRDDRYGRYERYDRYDRYERYRRYDRSYDDLYDRRRVLRRYPGDDLAPPREVQRKPKREREIEPAKAAMPEKPAKGPYQIVISIASQKISLYGADGLIRESKVSTGMRGHSTPTGVFSVIEKDYYHRSNIYSGAPMPLMQRITYSGVALHEGVLPGYPASHGCIRMTHEFAKFLWDTTERNARVIVARGDIDAPAVIASPKLFAPVSNPVEKTSAARSLAKDSVTDEAKIVPIAAAPADPVVETKPSETAPDLRASERPLYKAPPIPARKGQLAAFISRKTGKLYVRHANVPLFEMPVEIRDKDRLIGTHVFTAIEAMEDGKQMKWTSVSMATHPAAIEPERRKSSRNQVADIAETPVLPDAGTQTAAEALDRIGIPKEAYERIGELLTPGSSLTISDYGISEETGEGTEFIILTR